MEKLSTAQQQQLKKMSNDCLRIKLMAQGYEEDIVIRMEREELIVDPGAAVTKSPPPVIFCEVGVSHIYVTESQPPVIFMPT